VFRPLKPKLKMAAFHDEKIKSQNLIDSETQSPIDSIFSPV
jgi:hypothetical protein